MSMYILLEHSSYCSDTTGSLLFYSKDEGTDLNLDDSGISLLFSLLDLIWNCIIFLQLARWPWFIKGIWSWLYSSGGSKDLLA